MKIIEGLKERLINGKLVVQNEGGYIGEVGFKWNSPISNGKIIEFEKKENILLPESYKFFLQESNGAEIFKDTQYGQWGCNLLGLEDMLLVTKKMRDRGYDLNEGLVAFATWLGDGDILIFDLNKHKKGEKNYIIDGDQGYNMNEWEYLKGNFEKWLDRLIVAQGAKYWRWY